MNATNTTPTAEKLESEICSRCQGSGSYSYCSMYGRTCFKCGGNKRVLTKRGVAANRYLIALRSKLSTEIAIGDAIYSDGQYGMPKAGFYEVTEIRTDTLNEGCAYLVCGQNFSRGFSVKDPSMERVRQTKEQSAATWAKAMAYQATLTKMGKPSKKTEALLAAAA